MWKSCKPKFLNCKSHRELHWQLMLLFSCRSSSITANHMSSQWKSSQHFPTLMWVLSSIVSSNLKDFLKYSVLQHFASTCWYYIIRIVCHLSISSCLESKPKQASLIWINCCCFIISGQLMEPNKKPMSCVIIIRSELL